ncbi:hypothetical protein RhiirA1_474493 [Rhizophagus irregularis]|uniref:Uncharacterized protein n=1 Tax=Rhizophagus irregularis TaxID=588596 RepID=A0A2N0QYH4_9GLOM|nr:hypothetical protein RhiirA1_474493 [Rhizophagus irregularis]CAB4473471.1 unnamed protein product [Rhizophagus irregularis]
MGWNDNNILEILKQDIEYTPVTVNVGNYKIFVYNIGISSREKWCYAGPDFQASLIYTYEKKQSIYVSRFEEKKCIVEIYQECALKRQFIGTTPDEVWQKTGQLQKFTGTQLFGLGDSITKNLIQLHQIPKCILNDWNNEFILKRLFDYYVKRRTIANANWKLFFKNWMESENPVIELESTLRTIYPLGYEFNDRELSAWQSMLNAVGATNITPWSREESQHQLWTKSPNGQADKAAFSTLYKRGFLTSIPKNMPNATRTFWTCFKQALANNKKGPDGKQRVLSIIANEFTYEELKQNLNVGRHTILESRKHARSIGYGAPTRVKPIIH